MRKRILNTAWCGPCTVLLSVLFLSANIQATTVTVQVGPGGTLSYSPSPVFIATGDTVDWVWATGFHSVHSGTPDFPTPDFDSGTHGVPFSFSHTFATAGSFPYFCLVHGALMTSSVEVNV